MLEIREIGDKISIGLLDLGAFSLKSNISQKRELERTGTNFVLQKLLKRDNFNLRYSPQNKPFLEKDSLHISISHSHDKLAVIINKSYNTGIDIELLRDLVLKVRHKFLNEAEFLFAEENIERLTAIWAAKECMYKYYGLKNLDFKINLSVEDFDGEFIFGKIETTDFKKRFQMAKEKIGNYMMVYILKELAD